MTTIIGIILVIVGLIVSNCAGYTEADDSKWGGTLFFFSFILFTVGVLIIHVGKPTAIDVYRGKTTLQITYKNNVPIDSTVVYK